MEKGKFIVFEGIDGSGKTTQSNMIYNKLLNEGKKVFKTFEPTNRPIGKLLRTYLSGEIKADSKTLAGLFASDRLDHFLNDDDGIVKLYNEGYIIICDRNYFSSLAYQDDNDEDFVLNLNSKVREILKPDCHIFIDLKPCDALKRIKKSRENIDIFENEKELNRIYNNYKKYFKRLENEEKIVLIDGDKSLEEIHKDVINCLDNI